MGTIGRGVGLPLPWRDAALGATVLGCLGCVVGLVVGLLVYAPTAWAAVFEVGVPSALAGGVVGLAVGIVRRAAGRRHESSAHEEREVPPWPSTPS